MKRINIKIVGFALAAVCGLASCSDDFLKEKTNFDQASPEIYNNYTGCLGRLSDCYALCLPDPNVSPNWQYTSVGKSDDLSKCTEEFAGFGVFVDPLNELNTISGIKEQPDYFQGADAANVRNNVWGLIRNINDAIQGIEGGTLSRGEKDQLVGQLYFLRAWRYFLLVKWYGGVPIITEPQPIVSGSVTPRSSLAECVEFILDDLNKAATMLEPFTGSGQWHAGDNHGRVTNGTALALKGRVLTWWCSPLFNRANDEQRYRDAYEQMEADLQKINACGYKLYGDHGDGNTIKDWANMFMLVGAQNTEGVFFARFNNIKDGGVPDYHRNNPWEQAIRPSNTLGGGGIVPSATMVDIFPMRDGGVNGKTATDFYTKLAASTLEYDEVHPFMDRDPRFYRTFGFPGFEWTFSGNPMAEGKNMNPYQGSAYELWNYIWYLDKSLVGDHTSSNTYAADNLLDKGKGLYLTKRSTGDVYAYDYIDVANGGQGFRYSQASYMEIRYAEVLLNLAEVAAGAGRMDRAVELLGQIRKRAGYVEANNYGLTPAASSDQATCMAQVLYERQIELAYEGKRFDDMRRWLLFDGGVNFASIPGAPQTWILTGWGGNTCTWLGYKPLNGKRRENLEFQVKSTVNDGVGGKEWKSWDDMPDPIAKFVFEHGTFNPATGEYDAWTKGKTWNDYRSWRTGFRVQLNKLNVKNGKLDEALTKLKENFYEPYLQRKLKRGDGLTPDQTLDGMYVTFLPRYYLLGLTSNAQTKNPTLLQTIGWEDYNGGAGTFDPFASTATAE